MSEIQTTDPINVGPTDHGDQYAPGHGPTISMKPSLQGVSWRIQAPVWGHRNGCVGLEKKCDWCVF